jgi:hypothetical protein
MNYSIVTGEAMLKLIGNIIVFRKEIKESLLNLVNIKRMEITGTWL